MKKLILLLTVLLILTSCGKKVKGFTAEELEENPRSRSAKLRVAEKITAVWRGIYKSYEVPGEGKLNLDDSPEYIYRLLRSIDYGKNRIFPYAQTVFNNRVVSIKRYKLVNKNVYNKRDEHIYIDYDDERYLVLKYDLYV